VLAKKGKSNDDITDNKDNNNNNKCDTVSVKTVKKKRENVFQLLQFDTRVDLSVYTDWMPVMSKINI
jgi:DNA-binding NarL/FixJ family response regulator